MFLEALEELTSFKGCRLPRTGFAFYSEREPRTKRRSHDSIRRLGLTRRLH